MATYRHFAKITGAGQFPIDMLRYEECWPSREAPDSRVVAESFDGVERWEVKVEKFYDVKTGTRAWTPARWQSFGCVCEPLTEETRKAW